MAPTVLFVWNLNQFMHTRRTYPYRRTRTANAYERKRNERRKKKKNKRISNVFDFSYDSRFDSKNCARSNRTRAWPVRYGLVCTTHTHTHRYVFVDWGTDQAQRRDHKWSMNTFHRFLHFVWTSRNQKCLIRRGKYSCPCKIYLLVIFAESEYRAPIFYYSIFWDANENGSSI